MKTNSLNTPVICYGEILWDMLPDGHQPGGAPLNVSYHLKKLGMPTGIVSRVGNDAKGEKLIKLLESWGINRDFLQKDEEYPTSEVIARMNNGNEVTYEIVYPVAWDFINDSQNIAEQIKPSTYFVFGSLSSRNDVSRNTLLQLLEQNAVKVFDINLRPPSINRDLLSELLHKADIAKFNQAELEIAQSFFRGSLGNEAEQVRFIQDKFNVPEIVVTKGEFGASYYKNDKVYHAWGTEVKVKDTIGSGDSFLSAFIANHRLKQDPKVTIKNAVAMGAFIATKKGGCPPYDIDEYTHFRSQIF